MPDERLGITTHDGLIQFTMRGPRGSVKAQMTVDPRYVKEFVQPRLDRAMDDALAWRVTPADPPQEREEFNENPDEMPRKPPDPETYRGGGLMGRRRPQERPREDTG